MSELLNRRIDIREKGKTRKATVLEGILFRFIEDALKGNAKAASFLLNRKQIIESSEMPAAETLDMDDQNVLEFFKQQLEERLKNKEEGQ